MSDLFLIAHKVRGEPAFDVAQKILCPICEPIRQGLDISTPGCSACESSGHWWIIPTSGHRAYPYWSAQFDCIGMRYAGGLLISECVTEMPADLPDHYAAVSKPEPKAKKLSLSLEDLDL